MNTPRIPEDRLPSPVVLASLLLNGPGGVYTNPGNAVDGNGNTAATSVSNPDTCVWSFSGGVKPVSRLYVLSEVTGAAGAGATIQYSKDNGSTWTTIYTSNSRTLRWDEVDLPLNQDFSQLRVKATNVAGSNQNVWEICAVVGTAADKYRFRLTFKRPEFSGAVSTTPTPTSGQIFPTGRS